jgi:putative restriction endonuclease
MRNRNRPGVVPDAVRQLSPNTSEIRRNRISFRDALQAARGISMGSLQSSLKYLNLSRATDNFHLPMASGIPKNIKKEHILSALAIIDKEGYPKEHESIKYSLMYEGRKYPPVWVIRTANIFANREPLDPTLYSGGAQSNNFLKKFGFRIVKKTHSEMDHASFDFETMNRERIWREIVANYKGQNIPAHILRDTYRIYGGSGGIWVDRERTSKISNDDAGIIISVFHKGTPSPDDLSETSILQPYPVTNRQGRQDDNEIAATKNAKRFNIPVFVITRSKLNRTRREVKKGFVRDWDDLNKTFLIEYGKFPEYTKDGSFSEDIPFNLNQKRKRSLASRNETSPRFSFDVFKRYGRCCAVCTMHVEGVVTAAHIKPVSENGSDDPRNGIPLCRNHHAAFDKCHFTIHPGSYQVVTREQGPSKEELGIQDENISKLKAFPDRMALQWHYKRFLRESSE